jgi:uncharacterized protein YacL
MLCILVLGTNLTENMWRAYGLYQPRPLIREFLLPVATGLFLALLAFSAGWMMYQEARGMPPSMTTAIYRLIAVGWMTLSISMLIAWVAMTSSPLVVARWEVTL